MSTFSSDKKSLTTLVAEISSGKIQLPDFQRGWVWDDEHIRSLLASVAREFPIGAIMLLENGGEMRLKTRPVEGMQLNENVLPESLILDGQQRLTSLTQVLSRTDRPIQTRDAKGKLREYHYYVDIHAVLDDNWDEAFVAVNTEKRQGELDLSTTEGECKHLYFPCNQILNSDAWEEALLEHNPNVFSTKYMAFRKKVLNQFRTYDIPLIKLSKETNQDAVCLVFEKVNTGGVPLTVFELLTATFAAENFNLREDWYGTHHQAGRQARLHAEDILKTIEPTDFLQAVSLLHTREKRLTDLAANKSGKNVAAISAKRQAILSLRAADYQKWADKVCNGFIQAARFMYKQRFFSTRDLPYRSQLVPLAAVLAQLDDKQWLESSACQKLSQWFWCGVLGEQYGGSVETQIASDVDELFYWLNGGSELPRTIQNANFHADRLDTLRTRNSAAYKGINILILREGAQDFFFAETVENLERFQEVNLDIHHIFPQKWCADHDIPTERYNAITNKTPISYKANRKIGGNAPSKYLTALQHEQTRMDEILRSHLIRPDLLRTDDFEGLMRDRKRQIALLIEKAMGKPVSGMPDEV